MLAVMIKATTLLLIVLSVALGSTSAVSSKTGNDVLLDSLKSNVASKVSVVSYVQCEMIGGVPTSALSLKLSNESSEDILAEEFELILKRNGTMLYKRRVAMNFLIGDNSLVDTRCIELPDMGNYGSWSQQGLEVILRITKASAR